MPHTFGKQLKNFSMAVDVINEEVYLGARELIIDYTSRVLDIDFTRQLMEVDIDGEKGLMPFGLANEGKFSVVAVKDSEGMPKTQAAYCYLTNSPLWVVSKEENQSALDNSPEHLDLWSGLDDLPSYRYPRGEKKHVPIKTSILVPMRSKGVAFGVLNFETSDYLEITPAAKSELKLITEALSNLYLSYQAHESNIKHTRSAYCELQELLQSPLPKLTKPKVFLASSKSADPEVIETIKEVLKSEFKNNLTLVFWKDMHQPGNINAQLLELLGKCRYGICYLSEPIDESSQFRDNPNVVFEAGMLHGRSDSNRSFPASWIPIREEQSEDAPFDFTSERMVVVPRENGEVDRQKLAELLVKGLKVLIFGDRGGFY